MTGGGFGGCIIALVPAGAADEVAAGIAERFAAAGFGPPAHFVGVPSAGAGRADRAGAQQDLRFDQVPNALEVAAAPGLRAKICQKSSGLAGGDSVNIRKKMGLVTISVGACC